MLVTQLCPILCNPKNCCSQGSPVHGISQARILEWVSNSFSRGSSQHGDGTWVSCIAGRFFTIWATREAHNQSFFFVFNDNFKVVRCYCLCYFYYIWQLGMLKTLFLQYCIHLQILNTMTIENLVLFQIYKFQKSILTYQLLRKHTFKWSGVVCWTPNLFEKKNQFLTCSVTETHTYIFGNKLIYSQMRSMRMLGKLY